MCGGGRDPVGPDLDPRYASNRGGPMSGTRGGVGRIMAMGIGLALALVLLIAGEAQAAKYAVAQCGWYVGADADWADTTGGAKFRPDAFCVPGPAGRPVRRRPHEELHPRRPGHRHRHPLRAAGAGGACRHRHHPGPRHLVARPSTTGSSSGSASATPAAASTPSSPPRRPTSPRAISSQRLPGAGAGARGPPALRPRRKQVLLARPRLLVGAAGADDHARGRLAPGRRDRRRAPRRRLAPRRPGRSIFAGGELGAGIRFGETTLDGARVDLTEYPCAIALIGGEWRGTRMQPCQLGDHRPRRRSTRPGFSDGPHSVHHCAADFAGNVGCTAEHAILIDNNPPAHPRSTAAGRRRRLAPGRRLRPHLGKPRPGAGQPDRRRLLAPHRPRRVRQRRPVRGEAVAAVR